ncbi:MAG: hypothetical protein AAF467_23615 [Actinomycetota bacterium]
MGWLKRILVATALGLALLLVPATAEAQATVEEIADELAATGRWLEADGGSGLDGSIDAANDRGVAFVWFDSDDNAESAAEQLSNALADRTSDLPTVVVLTNSGVGAWSQTLDTPSIERGLNAGFNAFASRDAEGGLDAFVDAATAAAPAASTDTSTDGTGTATTSGDSGGGGLGSFGTIIVVGLVALGGFWLFRTFRSRSKDKADAVADLEDDRAEIKEQLRDNADHVLGLGDRVIDSGDAELQRAYEEASAAYQEVSHAIDGASTVAEIDALDTKIDHAEWQFQMIEARLDGRPVPPSPAEVEAAEEAEAAQRQADDNAASRSARGLDNDRPALGADESVFGSTPPAPRSAPPAPRAPRVPTRRRRSGMGGMGGLGGALGSVILGGGGLGRQPRSRRTQQRRSSRMPGGTLGGGVLRPRGSSRRSGSGGGRSFGSGGSGGGRSF